MEIPKPWIYEHGSDSQLRLITHCRKIFCNEPFEIYIEEAGRIMGISSKTKELQARIRSFIEPLPDIFIPCKKTPKGAVISWIYGSPDSDLDLAPDADRLSVEVNRNSREMRHRKATGYGALYQQIIVKKETRYKRIS